MNPIHIMLEHSAQKNDFKYIYTGRKHVKYKHFQLIFIIINFIYKYYCLSYYLVNLINSIF